MLHILTFAFLESVFEEQNRHALGLPGWLSQ